MNYLFNYMDTHVCTNMSPTHIHAYAYKQKCKYSDTFTNLHTFPDLHTFMKIHIVL